MSRLFPSPFQQYKRSAVRGDSIGVRKPAILTARAEVFSQPLAAMDIDFGLSLSHNFASPVGIHKSPGSPVRTFMVDRTQDSTATASFTSSSSATSISPTIKTATFTPLAEVQQI